MDNSLYFCNVEKNDKNESLINEFQSFSETNSKQVYIIKSPLGNQQDFEYDYSDYIVVLMPGKKICIINTNDSEIEQFEDFVDDFIEDIGFLSEKFSYKKTIGRPRLWRKNVISEKSKCCSIYEILNDSNIENSNDRRTADFVISLLIGSVNDIEQIGGDYPDNILDQIKKKIVLFDGDQSRFIYSDLIHKKRITIQGLAGTGKTELLLHKLKDIYVSQKDSRLVFTCYNKILAKNMEERIPEFFNFQRVDEQIKWNSKLWVMSSWGSSISENSGVYSYICHKYGMDFYSYSSSHDFDFVCKKAIETIKALDYYEYCFDYMFIDESQDFPKSFFELCELVTSKKIYVAGDIFQDIYDHDFSQSVESDYLLNKCYRTDPKTLMFAHAVGMGLFESPVIRWLDDKEWEACGYSIERINDNFKLTRKPLRRFDDVDTTHISNIEIIKNAGNIVDEVILLIRKIIEEYPTVQPDDIAVVFLESNNFNYQFADVLRLSIIQNFDGWNAIKGYETKRKEKDAVFISNKNNIKGLEFPFVISVVTNSITRNIFVRNTLYMMLTRSLITSYLIVDDCVGNANFFEDYSNAASKIKQDGFMLLKEPSAAEKAQQNKKVRIAVDSLKRKPMKDIINEVISDSENQISEQLKKTIIESVVSFFKQEDSIPSDEDIISRTKKMIEAFR